ncbi:MAG: helix-turn-helix domain-containing protein [Paludibacteraceae bacterium]
MNEKHIEEKLRYIEDFYTAVNGKWKLSILIVMYNGKKRFKEIQNCIPKITNRVLSKELKDLEANKMITRTVYDTMPVTIEYEVTEYCMTLKPIIQMMTDWGQNHRKKVAGK